jgi:hypothetical protein
MKKLDIDTPTSDSIDWDSIEIPRVKNVVDNVLLNRIEESIERIYSEEDMQEYAVFCIRCYEKGLPCIIAKDWLKQFKNE